MNENVYKKSLSVLETECFFGTKLKFFHVTYFRKHMLTEKKVSEVRRALLLDLPFQAVQIPSLLMFSITSRLKITRD